MSEDRRDEDDEFAEEVQMTSKPLWMGMCCDSRQDREACLSWFSGMVPDDWGLPFKAEILEDPETSKTKRLRAFFRASDGKIKQALCRFNKRNTMIEMKGI